MYLHCAGNALTCRQIGQILLIGQTKRTHTENTNKRNITILNDRLQQEISANLRASIE
jgi:hypothetical protein